jgi:hypothetical protein
MMKGIIIFIVLVGIVILQHLEEVEAFFDSLGIFFELLDSMPLLYQCLLFLNIILGVIILYLGGALRRRN